MTINEIIAKSNEQHPLFFLLPCITIPPLPEGLSFVALLWSSSYARSDALPVARMGPASGVTQIFRLPAAVYSQICIPHYCLQETLWHIPLLPEVPCKPAAVRIFIYFPPPVQSVFFLSPGDFACTLESHFHVAHNRMTPTLVLKGDNECFCWTKWIKVTKVERRRKTARLYKRLLQAEEGRNCQVLWL